MKKEWTDGKRLVRIEDGRERHATDITVCRNGFQSVVVTIDILMLRELARLADEYLAESHREEP